MSVRRVPPGSGSSLDVTGPARQVPDEPVADRYRPGRQPPRWFSLMVVPTGAAFLAYLVFRLDIRLGLVVTAPLMAVAAVLVWRALPASQRVALRARVVVGVCAGFVATLAYDSSKHLFAEVSGTSESPFAALPRFGGLLLGESAGDVAQTVAGTGFHLANGVTFGVAFALLARRPTWGKGIAFGLVLEAFQLALYPGWLNPKSYAEFASLTAFGHVVYGVTLGSVTAALSRRADAVQEVRT